jgi:hypothetical protein
MSQILDFKKRFGKQISSEEVKGNFVTKVNHYLVPIIDREVGSHYSDGSDYRYSNPGSRFFDYICVNFGLEPREIITGWNQNNYQLTEAIPSVKSLTGSDFEKTLLLVEIAYSYFKKNVSVYTSNDIADAIDSMVNEFVLQPISLGIFWRDGHFYPEGAVELDEKLIREPLDWLGKYSKIQKLYKNALDNYSQSNTSDIKRKDTCINAYQAVEEIAKIIVGEQKPFDSIFGSFGIKIGLNSHWQKILNQYREFSKEYGRHPGSTEDFIPDRPSTEAFLYLSGLLLRLSVQKLEQIEEK